ncbi:MAG: glutamate--tRNA ligase [Candidatus Peregrinibacteria bacterium]|nr:glutamate--tRNA ligase [Candidatus Peregrinibacteria bacterium]MDZ4244770.1 glutamate--tRNA ligase [Candidatus Gracilibacteria bacterium]
MIEKQVRTRFAPSPTGFLHVGGLRTALYAYLFARHNNGKMILRIEDTDRERLVPGATEHLQEVLYTMGIDYDEGPEKGGEYGPYIQSERLDIYKEYAQKLIDKGEAYYCFCTKERLTEMRESQIKRKVAPMYDKHCRTLPKEDVEKERSAGTAYVIRQAIPSDQKISFEDAVKGHTAFDSNTLDDHVLMKADGFPTYHLAVVVDDHLMEITHVIRGEEWIPSAPKHVALYNAFQWEIPVMAHLPLLLNPDKTKLSKRQGDVNVEDYLAKGYLKEAIINFIALLGWHEEKSDREIYSLSELIEVFTLERVQKSGAVFDLQKFEWINTHYIKKLPDNELIEKILPHLKKEDFWKENPDTELLTSLLPDIRTRLKTFSEISDTIKIYFRVSPYDKKMFLHEKMKVTLDMAKQALTEGIKTLEDLPENKFMEEDTKEVLLEKITSLGWKNGQLLWPMRVALSGEQFSPGVFELLTSLKKEESLNRLKAGLEKF